MKNFHETFMKLLEDKLMSIYAHMLLNRTTCMMIYTDIFNTIAEIITKSNVKLCNESINYMAQQFYDGILINGNQELDPNIFTQRATLNNIPTNELITIAVMMRGTLLAEPIITEIKQRS